MHGSEQTEGSSTFLRALCVCIAIAAITAAIYTQNVNHRFLHFDDFAYVTSNAMTRAGLTWEGLRSAFSLGHGESYWHPLTWLSLMADVELFGQSAGAMLLENAGLHALAAILFFLALSLATGRQWPSAFAALVFAAHPLGVESVSWVVERKTVLSGALCMLTLLLYVRHARRPALGRHAAMLAAFAAAMLAKPSPAPLFAAFLLCDYWPLGRFAKQAGESEFPRQSTARLVLEKIPMALVALIVTALVILSRGDATLSQGEATRAGLALRLANALVSLVRYMLNFLWPQDLRVFYTYPRSIPAWQWIGAAVLLAALAALAIALRRKDPWLLTGLGWFALMASPVLGLIQSGLWPAMADRFAYLPMIGLCITAAFGGARLLAGQPGSRSAVLGAFIIAYFAFFSWVQAGVWANGITLFHNAASLEPESPIIRHHLGAAFFADGRMDEALAEFDAATALAPGYVRPWALRGRLLSLLGQHDAALESLRRAVSLSDGDPEMRLELAEALDRAGRTDEALAEFDAATQALPEFAPALIAAGKAYLNAEHPNQALELLQRAIKERPGEAYAMALAARATRDLGDAQKAEALYRRAIALSPQLAEALSGLAGLLADQGRAQQARELEDKARQVTEREARAFLEIGKRFLEQGSMLSAAYHFRMALDIRPGWREAEDGLERATR